MADGTRFSLTGRPIDTGRLGVLLSNDAAGALVTFEGRVRNQNDGRRVVSLEYEAYPDMANAEGEAIMQVAIEKFELVDARCIHRTGPLHVGEVAVWVGVLCGHREQAFAACRYIIDEVKRRVPIWKKEHYVEEDSAWIAPHHDE